MRADRTTTAKPSPEIAAYCAFKSDRHRLFALISRDLRFVFIAALGLLASWSAAPFVPAWLVALRALLT
jgi:hypothetical protein